MSATINDVARASGVSPDIVRRVIGASMPDVGEETRRKVLDAAKAVGFPLSVNTRNVGVLFMDENARGLTHPFFASVLNAFKIAVEERGYDVTFINHNIGSDGMTYLEHCRYRRVDGVCLACLDFRSDEVRALVESEIPCVTVDHIFNRVPAVMSDNENGVHTLVDYAVSKGHKRIAFIHGHNNSIVTRTRIDQFYSAMNYHRLPVPKGYVRAGLYTEIGLVRDIIEELLSMPERPTCILLPDDTCYFGAIEATAALGLRIPEDVSFAGYDGVELTQQLDPPLTTIRQNADAIGKTAAQRLVELVENPGGASRKPIIVPIELLRGGTVGACTVKD